MIFEYPLKVMFKHCDPAGIVFYPRFFEMINDCVEGFFARVGLPFDRLHVANAIPTVEITTKFSAPCRLGDDLVLGLTCTRVGRTSLGLRIVARDDGQTRFEARSTIVFTDRPGRPVAWPDDLRAEFGKYVEEAGE